MSGMTGISLFAGVGGIDLAMERAGVTVTAAVEIDTAARGVLNDRFPHTTLFPDVTKVTADDLLATGFVPERGVISAGWPCQGNSVAGARGGMADPRSGLWSHVVRILAELRPRWFLGENVPGLLSVTDGEDFGIVLNDLADLGMGFAYRVLDAQFFGVPQRRRRVFIVGCLGDTGAAPVQVLLEPEGGRRHPPKGKQAGQGVAATLTAGVARTGVSAPGRRQEDDINLIPTLTARYGKGTDSDATDAMVIAPTLTACGGPEGGRTDKIPMAVVAALTSNGVGTSGADDNQAQAGHLLTYQKVIRSGERDSNGDLPPEVWAERPVAATLNLNDLCSETRAVELVVSATGDTTHTLTSEGADASEDGSGRGTPVVTTGTTVRRLTPLECERLQGFPDNWTITSNGKPQADSARYRQMGNAVAVPCLEWISRRIVAHHQQMHGAEVLDGAA